ncbi:MAG TPA: phenylacetate--CoA ligase family protein [Phycisphaerae bacterium]|nr:phenylacetate--CoA ligase family protein [Phycisphaerales bacterium]HRX84141.1 phenylacetate--CoA ligase family protein [Phycisphaerae bacterium]
MTPASYVAERCTSRAELVRRQRDKLGTMLNEVRARNPFQRARLGDIAFDAQRDPLSVLPLTTRAELQADQAAHPPYGTNLTYPLVRYARYHQTSGTSGTPLRWLDTCESWTWWRRCWQQIFRAADVTVGERIVFPFSFGPFIGFWAAFEAAAELGNMCLPAGGMSTAARLRYILDNAVSVVCCTPTYALRMAERARADGIDLAGSAVRALIVAGEPGGSVPAIRGLIESAWGARVYDHVGMTEIGAWGFEATAEPGVIRILESEFIAEVIDPASGAPVAEGGAGELVLTNLGRWGSPLIRYRTGDRVRLEVPEDGGDTPFARIAGGVAGRVDDMLYIRGNNVFPSAVEGIIRGCAGVAEFRLRVRRRDAMDELAIEIEPEADADGDGLTGRVAAAVRDLLHFSAPVVAVAPGTLARFEMKAQRVIRELEE